MKNVEIMFTCTWQMYIGNRGKIIQTTHEKQKNVYQKGFKTEEKPTEIIKKNT